jgi:TRAP-type C4-dicarboxylate transport system substrate-binding protein
MRMSGKVIARVAVAAVTFLMLVGCSGVPTGGVDKVAGDEEPTMLTMADLSGGLYHNPALQFFVDEVDERSGGAIQIEVVSEWGSFADGVEQMVVDDVASGKADLAWLPTRAFDTMGLKEFRALNAPMLIDSYALQAAVLESDIPADMLPSLDQLGVTGLALLADGLRKPISVEGPLLSPESYQGITFTSTLSETQAESIKSLGANTHVAIAQDRSVGLRSGEIQGFEMNLLGYRTNDFQYLAPYVTANVNLWASPVVLIANPAALDRVNPEQRDWIVSAATDASQQSVTMVDVDSSEMAILCDSGVRFGEASSADLNALNQAFEPVLANLAEDPITAGFVSRIEEIKSTTEPGPGLSVPADCTGDSPIVVSVDDGGPEPTGDSDGRFAGTYRWELTEKEMLAFIDANGPIPELEYQIDSTPWLNTMTLTDNEWTLDVVDGNGETFQAPGTYTTNGDSIVFDDPINRYQLEFTVSVLDDGSLKLEPGPEVIGADRFVFASETWQRVD